MPPKYENTLGERAVVIIIVSFLSLIVSLGSIGILLIPSFKASYQAIFYHIKHNQKQKPLIKTYFNELTNSSHVIMYSFVFVALLILLIIGFIFLEGLILYVMIYFLLFETLLMLLNAPPLLAFMALDDFSSLVKTVFLLGHLHTLPTVIHIAFMVISAIIFIQIPLLVMPLFIVLFVIIYFALSSTVYYKVLNAYQ